MVQVYVPYPLNNGTTALQSPSHQRGGGAEGFYYGYCVQYGLFNDNEYAEAVLDAGRCDGELSGSPFFLLLYFSGFCFWPSTLFLCTEKDDTDIFHPMMHILAFFTCIA